MLHIRLLGTIDCRLQREPVPTLRQGRPSALLAFLCVTNEPQSRNTIAELLWDRPSEQQGRSNLRYVLRDLRKALGDFVTVDGDSVTLNRSLSHWIDCITFASHIRSISSGQEEGAAELLQDLLNLYSGDFLSGFQLADAPAFEDWMVAQRRHFRDLFLQGLHIRIEQQMAVGEFEAGLDLNHYLLNLEPWREEAHRQRMLLLMQMGQRSAALKQYEVCRQVLADELDVPPMPETTSLYEQIKSGAWFNNQAASSQPYSDRVAVVPLPRSQSQNPSLPGSRNGLLPTAAPLERNNLGAMPELVQFVGRQTELAMLHQWIGQEQCQMLALLGLAGQGKSALAANFVQELEDEETTANYGLDHIIWRTITPTSSCIETLQDWLAQLGGTDQNSLSGNFDNLVAHLFALLEQKRCLLVLDDFDDMSAATEPETRLYAPLLRLFFQRRHRSCLLITSRERPRALAQRDERNRAFRWLELTGLSLGESEELLRNYGLHGQPQAIEIIWQYYAGNPLLLTQAAEITYDLFDGDLDAFAQEKLFFLGEIGTRLYGQMAARSPLELRLLQRLAEAQEPLDRWALWEMLEPTPSRSDYLLALRSLLNAFLIRQKNQNLYLPEMAFQFLNAHQLGSV